MHADRAGPSIPRWRVLAGWAPVAAAALAVLLAAYLVLRPSGSPGLVGRVAPDFTLRDLRGHPVRLAALRGHPLLINFWGVNCIYCRTEMPLLQRASVAHAAQGLIILGVDAQSDDASSIRDFAAERGVTYPMLVDMGADVGAAYGVQALPESVLVDRRGIVREAAVKPFLDAPSLQQSLAAIL